MSELINILATVVRASSHLFIGSLARDPEMKFLPSGSSVANARIAVNLPGSKKGDGKEPDWFKIEIWGELGQDFADNCHQGDLVEVTGRVRTNRWTDQQNQARIDLVITGDSWQLVRAKTVQSGGTTLPAQQEQTHDDEIPF